jgi:hypothetical protein
MLPGQTDGGHALREKSEESDHDTSLIQHTGLNRQEYAKGLEAYNTSACRIGAGGAVGKRIRGVGKGGVGAGRGQSGRTVLPAADQGRGPADGVGWVAVGTTAERDDWEDDAGELPLASEAEANMRLDDEDIVTLFDDLNAWHRSAVWVLKSTYSLA